MKFFLTVFAVIGVAAAVLSEDPKKHTSDPRRFDLLTASSVLMYDMQWHVVADAGVRLYADHFCFDELWVGDGHMPETCGPREQLYSWRKVSP
jgi:hypothetical protein